MPRATTIQPENEEIIERALLAAAGVFGVTRLAIKGTQRSGDGWKARAAMHLALHEAGVIWSQIGLVVGREHSSPRAAVARLRREMAEDETLRRQVERVLAILARRCGLGVTLTPRDRWA